MTGISKLSSQVFLINFGLAQLFCNPSTCWHIPPISELKTVGTIVFSSINSHVGQVQSCCNDLKSLMYSIVYLCHGFLPWQDIIKQGSVEQYKAAVLKKQTTLAKTLCQGLPLPFIAFTQYIQSLGCRNALRTLSGWIRPRTQHKDHLTLQWGVSWIPGSLELPGFVPLLYPPPFFVILSIGC